MLEGFSETTKYYIKSHDIISAAKAKFRSEWGQMLKDVENEFRKKGWVTLLRDNPPIMLQIASPDWPKPQWQKIHYGIMYYESLFEHGIVDFLHIEENVQNQNEICKQARRLLRPYQKEILSQSSSQLMEEPIHDILKGSLDLVDVTVDKIISTMNGMMGTECFIDEALFLSGKKEIWRTDFFITDPKPIISINFDDKCKGQGGQKFLEGKGCMGSPAISINGAIKTNYHNIHDDLPTNIMVLSNTKEISYGDNIYLSCNVYTEQGGTLWFYAESIGNLQPCFEGNWIIINIGGKPKWQHVQCSAKIKNSDNPNITEQGITFFLRSLTKDTNFLINNIEFGKFI